MKGTSRLSVEERISTPARNADRAVGRHARQILVVDGDLGLVLWVARTLVEAGYAAFPAPSVKEARMLAVRLDPRLNVLVVNSKLAGAAELVDRLKCNRPDLKVAVFVDTENPPIGSPPFADVVIPKPTHTDRKTASHLVHVIDRLLTLHRAA